MTRLEADFLLSEVSNLTLTRHPTSPLVTPAFDIVDRTGRTVYDCLYLALAAKLSGVMVTADEKLANGLVGTLWASSILKLKDVP